MALSLWLALLCAELGGAGAGTLSVATGGLGWPVTHVERCRGRHGKLGLGSQGVRGESDLRERLPQDGALGGRAARRGAACPALAPPRLSPVCDRLWIFRFSRREKLLLQVGQRCGFSLVCVRMWMSILYLPHGGHGGLSLLVAGSPRPRPRPSPLPHLALKPRPWRAQPSQWQQYPASFSGFTW